MEHKIGDTILLKRKKPKRINYRTQGLVFMELVVIKKFLIRKDNVIIPTRTLLTEKSYDCDSAFIKSASFYRTKKRKELKEDLKYFKK